MHPSSPSTGRDPLLPLTALLLDGGRATRFGGAHKAFLDVDGQPLVARTLSLLAAEATEVLVATSRPAAWSAFDVRPVADAIADGGPLSGIAGGLAVATSPLVLVVAADMPLVAPAVARHLVSVARARGDMAVVPIRSGRPEPLLAVYPAAMAHAARSALEAGIRKLTDFLATVPVVWVQGDALAALPGVEECFLNVNRPDDLAQVQELLRARRTR